MPTASHDQHVDPLTAMLYPAYTKRCDHCGGFVATSPEEALQRLTDAVYRPYAALAESLQSPTFTIPAPAGLPGTTTASWTSTSTKHRGHHHGHHGSHDDRGCGCYDCGPDDCHCKCCVVSADLVVNARLGERRIVPITIENNRRREREIKLELSEFDTKGGSPANVAGRLAPPTEFTLAPCEQRQAVLEIEVGKTQRAAATGGSARARKTDDNSEVKEGAGRSLPDVDDCLVAYADLRIVGCDNRPVRIAVSTLPRDCHAYPVDCACGCCG